MRFCSRILLILALGFLPFTSPAETSWKEASPNALAIQSEYSRVQLARLFDGKLSELEKEAAAPNFPQSADMNILPEEAFYESFFYTKWTQNPDWALLFKKLEEWQDRFPNSPYCRIAYANAMVASAWEARGSGTANTVTDKGWTLLEERLRKAEALLQEAKKLGGDKFGFYWKVTLVLNTGVDSTHDEYCKVLADAVSRFPETAFVYYSGIVGLLPRWYGEENEWQAWLKNEAGKKNSDGKDMDPKVYALILTRVFTYVKNNDGPFFENKDLSWEKTRAGLAEWVKASPDNTFWKSVTVYLAWSARDKKTVSETLATMNGVYDSSFISPKTFEKITEEASNP